MARNITISSVQASVTGSLITTQGGNAPGTPTITSPASNISLTTYTPTYNASAFFNYVAGGHAGSNWQLATDSNFTNIIYDLATTSNLTSFTVPAGIITANMFDIYVRVRYINGNGIMSGFSAGQRNFCQPGAFTLAGLFDGSSTINFTAAYAGGIGTLSTVQVQIANNSNMTSPAFSQNISFSSNAGTFSVSTSTLPGLTTLATPYFAKFTVVSGLVPATSVGVASAISVGVGSQYTTASGSFNSPASTRSLQYFVVGAGGGGSAIHGSGAGGGGGYITTGSVASVPANTGCNFAVGTGGGGSSWSQTAGTGGTTTLNVGGTTYSASGGGGATNSQPGTGGTSGGSPQQPGQASAYGAGGIAGSYGNSTGGQGGKGYGAGGGGNTRDQGDGPGGGGGGGYGTQQIASAGNFTNVGNGGTGAAGTVVVFWA
jgi:hypothetical protein